MLTQEQKKDLRHEKIMSSLDNLSYATRKHLQIINGLRGTRNAQRILQRMEREGLIKSERLEMKVYYLSDKGKRRIGSFKSGLSRSQIYHSLMRNDLYIRLGMPKSWIKERPVSWGDNEKLIPDATFKSKGEFVFVEIDHTQSMATNLDKIKKYGELSSAIKLDFNHTPTLVWYTLSDVRKQKLSAACKKAGVKFIVY